MTGLTTICPLCHKETTIWVDTSEGVPNESASHCKNCEKILVYKIAWEPNIWLDGFIRSETDPILERHKAQQAKMLAQEQAELDADGSSLGRGLESYGE